MYRNKKRGQFTSTFLPGIAKHLNHLKRANAHAKRRELSTSSLATFCQFADFQMTRIKSGRSSLLSLLCLCYVTIPYLYYRVRH